MVQIWKAFKIAAELIHHILFDQQMSQTSLHVSLYMLNIHIYGKIKKKEHKYGLVFVWFVLTDWFDV